MLLISQNLLGFFSFFALDRTERTAPDPGRPINFSSSSSSSDPDDSSLLASLLFSLTEVEPRESEVREGSSR